MAKPAPILIDHVEKNRKLATAIRSALPDTCTSLDVAVIIITVLDTYGYQPERVRSLMKFVADGYEAYTKGKDHEESK